MDGSSRPTRGGQQGGQVAVGSKERAVTDPKAPPQGVPPASLGSSLPPATLQVHEPAAGESSPSRFSLWLHRVTVLMFVFLCASVGVLLVILPWRPEWTDNHLLFAYPNLQAIMGSGFVRGIFSGLGILNIWIGFWEAVHYHEGN